MSNLQRNIAIGLMCATFAAAMMLIASTAARVCVEDPVACGVMAGSK